MTTCCWLKVCYFKLCNQKNGITDMPLSPLACSDFKIILWIQLFFFSVFFSWYTFLRDVKSIDILLAFVLFFFTALFWLYCWFTRHWFTLLNHIENEIVSIIQELIFSFYKPTSCFVTFLCSSATEYKMYLSYLLPWQLSCKALIYFFK